MAEKARDAFRTISEVANWLDVPAHVLRFWESKFPQIKPVKRAGGRRYYRPADMELIGGIKKLLHDDGLTIRGVQKMIKEEGVKNISALSPPLDMPSEEEAAARRKARRARRQARQEARREAEQSPKRLETPAPPSPPEDEAPFTHVEEAEIVPETDNVVQLPSRDSAASEEPELDLLAPEDEVSAEAETDPEAELEADEVTAEGAPTLPGPPDPEPPLIDDTERVAEADASAAQDSFALEDATPETFVAAESDATAAQTEPLDDIAEPEAESEPEVTTEAAELAQDEPTIDASDMSPEEEATPTRPIIATEQLDPSTITVSDAQRSRIDALRKYRLLEVGTVLASGSQSELAQAHERLQILRDRLAIDLERR